MLELLMLELWLGIILLVTSNSNCRGAFVGVNIGTDLSNLPSATDIVAILGAHQITHVRLFDADAHMLTALSDTGIEVIISVTNKEILGIGRSPSVAAAWINRNVVAFLPSTNITAIAVGSDVLSSISNVSPILVPAMNYLQKALVASNLNNQVKVSTPQSMDLIPRPFPPSTATFNSTWNFTIFQMLQFLKNTNSYYMLNAYPYFGYIDSNGIFPIDYALFRPLSAVNEIVDPNTLFRSEEACTVWKRGFGCPTRKIYFDQYIHSSMTAHVRLASNLQRLGNTAQGNVGLHLELIIH